jgi:hypothetical protein
MRPEADDPLVDVLGKATKTPRVAPLAAAALVAAASARAWKIFSA